MARFEWQLEQNLFALHRDLKYKHYQHGAYSSFYVRDPKQRHIHKALVRDRIVHHALTRVLTWIFEPTFIHTSFSCRVGRGTHKGVEWLGRAVRTVSRNYTQPCFVFKCDIRKFFDSINQQILIEIIERKVKDTDALWLVREVATSFSVPYERERESKTGVPIGNLTSQLFANIYMNELDQFVKHGLAVKYYSRYTDDFVIVANDKIYLERLLPAISSFLSNQLKLTLHPQKVSILPIDRGADFLGYVTLPHHRVLRTKTKQRMWKKLKQKVLQCKAGLISPESLERTLASYLGVLSHANAYHLVQELKNQVWFWLGS